MECWQNQGKIIKADNEMLMVYAKFKLKYTRDMCDYCDHFYRGVSGHRCSKCLTKVYCGEECKDKDWVVHKLVCREGEEGRKKKGGRGERKKIGSGREKF